MTISPVRRLSWSPLRISHASMTRTLGAHYLHRAGCCHTRLRIMPSEQGSKRGRWHFGGTRFYLPVLPLGSVHCRSGLLQRIGR